MRHFRALILATLLVPCAAQTAAAVCTPFLEYIDLGAGGGTIATNSAVYPPTQSNPVINTPYNPTCNAALWRAVVAQVNVPVGCSGVAVWVQYDGDPQGFTLDVADSDTDNGYGGDSGSTPMGQNAELQILNNILSVFTAASVPTGVDQIATQQLQLKDGAVDVVVKDQFVSWGQPYGFAQTPNLKQLFFLPANPTSPDNRTIYVGLNRVVLPINGQDTARNGCGARRAILVLVP